MIYCVLNMDVIACTQCGRPTSRRFDVINSVSVQLQHILFTWVGDK